MPDPEAIVECASLEEVRSHIDAIDRQIVALLARRGAYVEQVMRFKRDEADVRAPARVEQVVANVRRLAADEGADPDLVEAIYRTMIGRFIDGELRALTEGLGTRD
jgi:isochorismate pyruvate lyase